MSTSYKHTSVHALRLCTGAEIDTIAGEPSPLHLQRNFVVHYIIYIFLYIYVCVLYNRRLRIVKVYFLEILRRLASEGFN